MVHNFRIGNSSKNRKFHQKAELWHKVRKTMITGSSCGILMHRGSKDTTTRAKIKQSYASGKSEEITGIGKLNCDYGNFMEDTALKDYAKVVKYKTEIDYPGCTATVTLEDISFYVEASGVLMASPDSEVNIWVEYPEGQGEPFWIRGVVEVKCPAGSYFAKRRWARTTTPITYQSYPDLLPPPRKEGDKPSSRKYGPPAFEKPRLSLTRSQVVQDFFQPSTLQQDSGTPVTTDKGFCANGVYSQYYFQCLANLILSDRDFIDFFVWTSPQKNVAQKTHRFWYKDTDDPYPSMHLERLHVKDPLVQCDYERLINVCSTWIGDNYWFIRCNIEDFLMCMISQVAFV